MSDRFWFWALVGGYVVTIGGYVLFAYLRRKRPVVLDADERESEAI